MHLDSFSVAASIVAVLVASMSLAVAGAATAPVNPGAAAAPTLDPVACDGHPVIMVVAGTSRDPARMAAYAAAIRAEGLYPRLAGYYLNYSRPVAVFEGDPGSASVLLVRFPCLAHSRAFWFSRAYQERIKPLRENPAAGDYTVTVYAERDVPPELATRVAPAGYRWKPSTGVIADLPMTPAFTVKKDPK